MAAVLFDTQKFVKRLQAAKFPPEQAEAQSDAMREVLESAFASHAKAQQEMTARVLDEFDGQTEKALIKLEAKMDKRFAEVDKRFTEIEAKVDKRFAEMDSKMDKRFVDADSKVDKLKSEMDTRFAEVKGELILLRWMIGAVFAGIVTLLIRAFTV